MTEPICEEEGPLQEWSEVNLLNQIPLRVQRGIFSTHLSLTCIDVAEEYMALGTNCGFVYWYSRASNELQRLRFENSFYTVTCVKIVSTVDYMVAAGSDSGNVTVFQIPKILSQCVPPNLKPKSNQVERFTINDLHKTTVTSIEWSQNGMKLFSGDKNGLVVITEIDFYMHLSKSMELLNEQFEIIDLKYNQQILLVSTTFRSIICDSSDSWKVHQVGTKERKMLGKFGATFCKSDSDSVIFASRPGHRLWLASTNGVVQQTLLFKTAISSSYPKIQLINPVSSNRLCNTNFGKLVQFGCNKLIAYNQEIMYILNPGTIGIVSCLDSARKIMDLAANEDEIFILEGERNLLRIGYAPDKFNTDTIVEIESRRKSFIFDDFASKIKDTAMESFKKITSEFAITPKVTTPDSSPVLADEALMLPPVVNLPPGSVTALIPDEDVEIHFSVDVEECKRFNESLENIGIKPSDLTRKTSEGDVSNARECNEVLSRPLRRRNRKKNKISRTSEAQELESDTTSSTSEDRVMLGVTNDISPSEESSISFSQSQSSFSLLRDMSMLLTRNNSNPIKSESYSDEAWKTLDNKSQLSLDTCESVSENLRLTPEKFFEEQEKTFLRLANHDVSYFDTSREGENTESMSVSLNVTPSSSVSSKISDNGQWVSEPSENASIVSEGKTENESHNEILPLPKHLCFYNSWSDGRESSVGGSDEGAPNLKVSISSEISDLDNTNSPKTVSPAKAQKIDANNIETENIEDVKVPKLNIMKNNISEYVEDKWQRLTDSEFQVENSAKTENYKLEEVDPKKLLLGSCQADDYSFHPKLDVEQSDHWLQYEAPGPAICLAVASTYIVCIDSKEQVYYSGLSGLSLSWNPLTYNASWIGLSNNGSTVWILRDETLFSLVDPAKKGPFADNILKENSNVKFFALDNENPEGWIVTLDGRVKRHRNLLASPFGKAESVSCGWFLTSIACWNGVVLALTSERSLVCKPPNEDIFRSIISPNLVTTYIALGPDNLAWVVDGENNIYFSDDFLSEMPHWWQIIISDYVFQNSSSLMEIIQNKFKSCRIHKSINLKSTMVVPNEKSVWVFDKYSSTVNVNKTAVTGYMWTETSWTLSLVSIKWQSIHSSFVFGTGERLWLYSKSGDLFTSLPDSKHFQTVAVPCQEIRCISSSTRVLWLLSSDGCIYARLGFNNRNSAGSSWKELNLSETNNSEPIWISCGCEIAWACDIRGKISVTADSPDLITTRGFPLLWVGLEDKSDETVFEKVFAGPSSFMVWAIDKKHNVYVREGISPNFQTGTGWILVTGLCASTITISNSSVWALSLDGFVYRRHGITKGNCVGDYWKRIPGLLSNISSSFSDELWGVNDSNSILKLLYKIKIFTQKRASNNEEIANIDSVSLTDSENEWEISEDFKWI